ncbi:CAP domain-containing protein [Streptomyces sp. AK02-04a]|uniref:CAP domain-containing protein n=1 Tax=Streptomyces sp. AK02-04a TaxID=3028649 RepID=UPI0029AF1C64|nr:CAP domain-containing protein [Streptomyces sp. AK02-04a]MDX3763112.1 CAP domain-containing protein [Streptomyces sp. AK02-04a]
MTARHKKAKELTPLQKRALRAGALAPVSAGFILVAATGAFAEDCPRSQTESQQSTQSTQQDQPKQTIQQGRQSAQLGSISPNVSSQREWHGRQGDWQGDWKLDENGHWQGQWTPVKDERASVPPNTGASKQREWHGRQGDWQGDWKLDENGHWQGQWTRAKQQQPTQDPVQKPQPTRHGGQPSAAPTTATVGRILQLVNKERAAAGLHPLTLNSRLTKAAQAHSDEMARTGKYSHDGPDGSSPGDRIQRAGYGWSRWAENIHHRPGSPEAIMADWMNSPAHRANILNPNLREIGIGVDAGSSYWTQDFGTSQ